MDSRMADIDEEDIDGGLWWANHVLSGSNKLDDSMIELSACPSVSRLIAGLVPIEELRHFVGHITHATSPSTDTLLMLEKETR